DPVFAPGTRFDYALTNWILVQAILETVSGARFPDLVRALVTTPLRLPATRLEHLSGSQSYRTLDPPTVWT
ncbi:serine hydrolase, partial [Klebsiella aerogenes]